MDDIAALERAEKRNAIANIFVAALLAVALQEAVNPVRVAVRQYGLNWYNFALFIVFFLNVTRFFIGDMLHLGSRQISKLPPGLWIMDFFFIVLQAVTLIFMGGVASVEESRIAKVDLFTFLLFLYALDVLWIVLQWFLGIVQKAWKRESVPWGWAILNTLLTGFILFFRYGPGDPYSVPILLAFIGLGVAGFLADMFLINQYKAM